MSETYRLYVIHYNGTELSHCLPISLIYLMMAFITHFQNIQLALWELYEEVNCTRLLIVCCWLNFLSWNIIYDKTLSICKCTCPTIRVLLAPDHYCKRKWRWTLLWGIILHDVAQIQDIKRDLEIFFGMLLLDCLSHNFEVLGKMCTVQTQCSHTPRIQCEKYYMSWERQKVLVIPMI